MLQIEDGSHSNEEFEKQEIIEKDRTFNDIIEKIRSASTFEEAKEIFFANIISLLTCEEVNAYFDEIRYDEEGKRYTLSRTGQQLYFVRDLMGDFLDDFSFGEESPEDEREKPSVRRIKNRSSNAEK